MKSKTTQKANSKSAKTTGYDDRTSKYLTDVRNDIGWLGCNCGWDDIEALLKKHGVFDTANLRKIDTHDGYVNSSDIEIYTYNKDGVVRYCAQLSYTTNIDDYAIETHIFSKQPSRDDVLTARLAEKIEFETKFGLKKTEFACWECGRHVHWLDCDGTLADKYERLKNSFCGFCDAVRR